MTSPTRAQAFLSVADTTALDDPRFARRCEALLTDDERGRRDRYLVEHRRREFSLGRLLARTSLSQQAEVPPEAWRFSSAPHGKLAIAAPHEPGLRFNLAHAEGLVACLVSRDAEVGVDVEAVDRPVDHLALVAAKFSPEEDADVRAQSEAARAERFYSYWTLKEAYVKARGVGLSALDEVSFNLRDDGTIYARLAPSARQAAPWHFELVRINARHLAAVALACDGPAPALHVARFE